MNTQDFLSALGAHPSRALIFDLGERRIRPGYHVTEIKAVNVQAVDCGGQKDTWQETTIQLWAPGGSDERYMNVGKFLNIYQRVAARVEVTPDAELRLEYGDVGAPAISYLVQDIDLEADAVVVALRPPSVACKAVQPPCEMALTVLNTASCCTPTPSTEQNVCCG